MNNIAEGFERRTNKEFTNFLYIAKGSCGEVRSMLQIALGLQYLTEEDFKENNDTSIEISKMLSGLIKTL
jgi:four helix bundle protein